MEMFLCIRNTNRDFRHAAIITASGRHVNPNFQGV
jgi:hypothetical protein